jgi:hypothetical protein
VRRLFLDVRRLFLGGPRSAQTSTHNCNHNTGGHTATDVYTHEGRELYPRQPTQLTMGKRIHSFDRKMQVTSCRRDVLKSDNRCQATIDVKRTRKQLGYSKHGNGWVSQTWLPRAPSGLSGQKNLGPEGGSPKIGSFSALGRERPK